MDISSAAMNFGIIAPEIILLIAGMIMLLAGNFLRNKAILAYFSAASLAVALVPTIGQWNNPQSGFFGMVMVDNFSVLFNIIFISGAFITILIARSYLVARGIEKFEFYPLMLFCTVGMMTMASSSDLIVIFLGLEIMSVPLYIMAGLARHDLESNESSIKYFMMGAFASAFLLYGIALIYGASETTDLRRIIADYEFIMMKARFFLIPGAILVLIGFGFKVAAVPFHMWVPDVYQGAPTPVTGFFSVGPKAAGFAALLRIFIYGFPALTDLTPIFWILAVVTMTVGNLLAIFQPNIKRMLAYSSIAHAGYILVALTAGGDGAVSSALYYLTSYTFFNLGAFAVITMIDSRAGSKAQIDEMKGLSKTHPYLAAFLALFMFALAGFPPTAGFFGKFFVFSEAVRQGYIWLVVIAVLNSFVSVYYYLRVIVVSYFGKPEVDFRPVAIRPAMVLALFITAAGTLILGLMPGYWLELTRLCTFPFI